MSRQIKRHQQAMTQQEKMVALGQMAAGVTHEIANPLASMDSLLQLMQRKPDRIRPDAMNVLREQIARINQQLGTAPANGATAALLDERDVYIQQLSQLMDVRVVENERNQVALFSNSGIQLVGTQASQIAFDPQGTMTPAAAWSSDASVRTVGTLTLISPTGAGAPPSSRCEA